MGVLKKIGIVSAIVLGLICVSIPVIGGYMLMNKQDNQELKNEKISEKEKKFMETQKDNIELFLEYNYNNVKKITLDDMGKTPLGYYIKGRVNDDSNLNFEADLDSNGNFNGYISMSNRLANMAKFEKSKSVKEIKKEQQETSMTSPKKQTRSMEEILADARAREEQIFNRDRT